ncbi:UTP--glucose-1-phosphate uridylyltransferase [Ureibacillus massiliensis 4400831 = CIP 108448 = CCUG 49529]|uniref:UTP--glucose-1-phosphate uridylyltransferase n=1 Tax=Ureibacillus massiliensis 4400831 = CIP 108448 = CCUG 49529 TaxID=1211035 RepID=A0A0A3JIN3_9BACL|nr:UTP--glucose-1-phosphate uridylyltransferase GalU [Ureibacillus massiliensis]KGR86837.1 UTP--glucose-1-phosphate uridylyltransferase [Ureibacillus massiliensis 4400831 = CIP 108448 = CCUG 49529]
MTKKVRKAVIPAAGLGTRFLPATKAQPKEMLPIVDKPTIQYIVEEAVASGIEDIIIISGRNKRAIEDHFDKTYELEELLAQKGKWDDLKDIQDISNLANIHYIRQKEQKGLGDAIFCAHRFIGDEPFAVLLGDIVLNAEKPALAQLIETYEKEQSSVIGVQAVPMDAVHQYGVINPANGIEKGQPIEVKGFVEKPKAEEAPSNLAIMGRYVLTPNIFKALEATRPGVGGEIQLTDAIELLNHSERIVAQDVVGKLYDIGSKFGFIQATLEFALEREDLQERLREYLRTFMKEEF